MVWLRRGEESSRGRSAEDAVAGGAGIVADSIPEKEWNETIIKAGILGSVAASIETTQHHRL